MCPHDSFVAKTFVESHEKSIMMFFFSSHVQWEYETKKENERERAKKKLNK